MAKDFSFDVVSDFDAAEMANAIDQAQREIANRYDFKNTSAKVDFVEGKTGLLITADSDNQAQAVLDVVQGKLIKRGLSLKTLDSSAQPVQGGKEVRWTIPFKKGLDQDKAKQVTKAIREAFPKVKTQVQGDAVRVTSSSKDDLQGVMAALKAGEFDFPLDFVNYR
ncbi:MAG TPA: YajQ family cyclic di-GMP-binding protein [Candidatus Saccharimonadales bacterium]|nr:YajQ family cyclic di-GMP-binding protein [Candidatus Saccharimonadales bacterium]